MMSVAEARARLLGYFQPLPSEVVDLAHAAGRVLAQAVVAPHALPPFNNSSMDGYAVRAVDVLTASAAQPTRLPVQGDVAAGGTWPPPLAPHTAVRIMTGAPMPTHADAVIPVEDTDDHRAQMSGPPPAEVAIYRAVSAGAYVRPLGQDVQAGAVVLPAGTVLHAAEIGLLAGVGQSQVVVHRRARVALFSTGNELVEVSEPLGLGQIHDTNRYSLAAALQACGAQVVPLGIARDTVEAVRAKLSAACEAGVDLIVSSAGVSVGAYDVVKAAVEAEGQLDFWRVRMRPGKPLAFGAVRGVPFVGLAGNPVSALVGLEVFIRPAVLRLGGHQHGQRLKLSVMLQEAVQSDGRESYLRVKIVRRGLEHHARLTGDQGSAILSSLAHANGLLIVPEGLTEARAGEKFTAWVLDAPIMDEGE